MLRRLLVVVVALVACGDDGGNRHLADAPPIPDADIDAPIDAPEPKDLELGLVTSGNGAGRITSSPAGIDCGSTCTASFEDGTLVTLTAEPATGSLFTGWGGACAGTTPVCEVTIDAATSVTATFTLKTYTVTVSKAGAGSGTVAGNGITCGATCTATVDHGTMISLTATPVALNNFVGWGGACSGTGTCDATITDDTTITAAFALDELSLIVSRGGNGAGTIASSPAGINCGTDCDEVYTANQVVTLTPTAAASSTFTGWTGACTGTGACVVTMNAAKAVTGAFTLRKFALDVTKTGGTGTGTVSSAPAGIACGTDCTENYDHGTIVDLTATPSANSTFTAWTGACTGGAGCRITVDGAKSVNAQFTIKSYNLTANVTAGNGKIKATGIDCPGDCTGTYIHGTSVTVTAEPGVDSHFTGWGGDCTGMGACVITMDGTKSVTASFAINTYDLMVSRTGLGTITGTQINCPGDCIGTFNHGVIVPLTAMPAVGYTFTGWGGACTGNGACSVTMDMAKIVTATFTLNTYTLTASRNGTGTGTLSATGITCPGDCTETFNHGDVVAVTNTPSADSDFTGWGGACSGTGTCMVTMTMDQPVSATFTKKSYDLDVTLVGNGSVTGSQITCPTDCRGTFTHGVNVSLTAMADPGYRFTGWSGACTGTGACSVPMTMAQMVTATFTQVFTLTTSVTGPGKITATGIDCGTDCTEDYLNTTPVTLTATPTGTATFGGWGGACSGTVTTCTVTMNAAKTVTATFRPLLTVTVNGDGFGTVTATGINCPGDCMENYAPGTLVTLAATPNTTVAAQASTFAGWSGACSGAGTSCVVDMSAARDVTATFTLAPNLMFVTTEAITIQSLGTAWEATADRICQQAAAPLTGNGPGQNKNWRAWISGVDTNNVVHNARDRIGSASGWVRPDGLPVFYKISDLPGHNVIYPPIIDQVGANLGTSVSVWTGTDATGRWGQELDPNNVPTGNACDGALGSWTNSEGRAAIGLASANSAEFTQLKPNGTAFNPICTLNPRRLYCMGVDRTATINVTRKGGRVAFTTRGTFVSSAQGVDGADRLCQDEAAGANLANPGRFRALLATNGASAISRFTVSASDAPWVRAGDLQPITRSETEMRSTNTTMLRAAPNAYADGTRIGSVDLWTGASHPAIAGDVACVNWTNTSARIQSGWAFDTGISPLWFGASVSPCSIPKHLVCMENLQ